MRQPGKTTLKVVTMPNEPEQLAATCDGGYTCECAYHSAERAKLVRVGVRRTRPIPMVDRPRKRAA